ncbi:hypothetical protein SUGI_0813160 [Cryptomeria japonica]|nr:hypothetical protein SUGI_0813160 [Cryptomeria japonica]
MPLMKGPLISVDFCIYIEANLDHFYTVQYQFVCLMPENCGVAQLEMFFFVLQVKCGDYAEVLRRRGVALASWLLL